MAGVGPTIGFAVLAEIEIQPFPGAINEPVGLGPLVYNLIAASRKPIPCSSGQLPGMITNIAVAARVMFSSLVNHLPGNGW